MYQLRMTRSGVMDVQVPDVNIREIFYVHRCPTGRAHGRSRLGMGRVTMPRHGKGHYARPDGRAAGQSCFKNTKIPSMKIKYFMNQ